MTGKVRAPRYVRLLVSLAVAMAAMVGLLGLAPRVAFTADPCAVEGPDAVAYQPFASEARSAFVGSAVNGLFPTELYFNFSTLERGPRSARTSAPVSLSNRIPPVVLQAIGWIEVQGSSSTIGSWAQAVSSVPQGSTGPTLKSGDCGYGIMQITLSNLDMRTPASDPTERQAQLRVAQDYRYNIANGATTLVSKWNIAPELRPIVGDGDPAVIEHWYYAIWSYNKFTAQWDPAAFNPNRPAFSCGPTSDGLGHNRLNYPYQELVLGCIKYPPVINGVSLWEPFPSLVIPKAKSLDPEHGVPPFNTGNLASMDFTPRSRTTDPTTTVGTPGLTVSPPDSAVVMTPTDSKSGSVSIRNTGTGLLSWQLSATPGTACTNNHNPPSWLDISATTGIATPSQPAAVTFTPTIPPLGTHNLCIRVSAPSVGTRDVLMTFVVASSIREASAGGVAR